MVQTNFLPKTTPPLKWAGGKRWLVPRLRELYQAHRGRRLVVPFAGGLGDTLGLWPGEALINDTNVHLMNFYRWWRLGLDANDYPEIFINTSKAFDLNKRNFNETILKPGGAESKQAAVLFFYLLRSGFNGLCRFNRKGEYNVGYGKYKQIDYNEFLAGYDIPRGWQFICGDFSLLRALDYSPVNSDDYIYSDPPYDNGFVGYSAGGFTWANQVALVAWLADHTGPAVISNSATDRVIALYQDAGFQVERISAPRRISCDGNRDNVQEVLATRNI